MTEDAISRLNELLEAERAGVETLAWLSQQDSMQDMQSDLKKIGQDESWSCWGLRQAVLRHKGILSSKKGDFAQKIMALDELKARLELLARGQAWVVKRLDVLIDMNPDMETQQFLKEMREKHQANIQWCQQTAAQIQKQK